MNTRLFENGLLGYERTKALLKQASRLIDEGRFSEADLVVRQSKASRADLVSVLGGPRLKKIAKWARSQS
jgi:hypothetical protein